MENKIRLSNKFTREVRIELKKHGFNISVEDTKQIILIIFTVIQTQYFMKLKYFTITGFGTFKVSIREMYSGLVKRKTKYILYTFVCNKDFRAKNLKHLKKVLEDE